MMLRSALGPCLHACAAGFDCICARADILPCVVTSQGPGSFDTRLSRQWCSIAASLHLLAMSIRTVFVLAHCYCIVWHVYVS